MSHEVYFVEQRSADDCFQACLSGLTRIPLGAFPVITKQEADSVSQWNMTLAFLKSRGWTMVDLYAQAPVGWSVGSGPSPRGDWDHCVLCQDGKPAFDPHTSSAFLAGPVSRYIIPIEFVVTGRDANVRQLNQRSK